VRRVRSFLFNLESFDYAATLAESKAEAQAPGAVAPGQDAARRNAPTAQLVLTECGRVEFLMVIFADYISDASIEAIFHDLSGPLGPKIVAFKQWCDFSGVPEDKKPILDRVCKKLDELLPVRNFLVHGETHEAIAGGKKEAYPIGINKKDMDYLDEFERGERGKNVFNGERVKAATRLTREIYTDLHLLRYGTPAKA
jgi:hypothetical protein